ncbi:hypothetical protein LOAG_13507, partial [Loa loa]
LELNCHNQQTRSPFRKSVMMKVACNDNENEHLTGLLILELREQWSALKENKDQLGLKVVTNDRSQSTEQKNEMYRGQTTLLTSNSIVNKQQRALSQHFLHTKYT